MSKDFSISYDWYLKDWATNEQVLELTLAQRGAYRELIDKAYKSGNRIPVKISLWSRLWNCTQSDLETILETLQFKGLIVDNGEYINLPSVGKRLSIYAQKSKAGKESAKARVRTGVRTGVATNSNSNSNSNSNDTPPTLQEFKTYAKDIKIYKSSFDFEIESKYQQWISNDWKDGHDKPIKNWKIKLKNTMPYFKGVQQTEKRTW